jgi:hypothetical protein
MKQTRNYKQDEAIEVGDVVQVYDGSFGDAVVGNPATLTGDMVWLYRAHLMMDESGNWVPHIETFSLHVDRVRELPVYVTGIHGRIENRAGKR